ncbi:MAG: response regulator [Lachnospiraceae bacterium]|nr:response regulator [Lachnospiraceae bacterium]
MGSWLDKYLGENIPIKERLFYIASFSGSLGGLLFSMFGFLVRLKLSFIGGFLFMCVFSAVLFFGQSKFRNRLTLHARLFLIVNNLFAFPVLMLINDNNTVEIPIYFFIGFTFGVVLLSGLERILYLSVQFILNILCAFYCFVLRTDERGVIGAETPIDYARIEIAIIMASTLCGIMIFYRNRLLSREMRKKEEATQKAEQVNFAKDMFLVNVSHEIRTPLNAIIGTADMVIDSDAGNHVKEMAFNISNSSHALLSITSDLLDFSRMNVETFKPVSEKYDITGMLNDIVNLISVRLLDSNVEFYVNVAPNLPKILIGDGGKIRQIIINMLSNAVKYTKEGHMTFNVGFEYGNNSEILLKISVEDTGIGIKEENLEKIFVPYNRSGEITDRLIEGNGLGLALCRKLSEAMGGRIYAESVYGSGSTFFFEAKQKLEEPYTGGYAGTVFKPNMSVGFYSGLNKESERLRSILQAMEVSVEDASNDEEFLKISKKEKHEFYLIDSVSYERIKERLNEEGVDWKKLAVISPCNYSYSDEPFEYVLTRPVSCLNLSDLLNKTQNFAIRKQMYEGKFSIPGINILVVDDNLVNLEVTANILSRYEARIITAASGREGITVIENERVDMVFLDYMMPDMDGIDTLKEIRKINGGAFWDLPVIALTANVVSGARDFFLESGFDDYLSKPIEIDKMEKIIVKHLPGEAVKIQI